MNILLVEHNPIKLVVIEETLDTLGYRAEVVNTGIRVLEKLSRDESQYNIVLMDCDIPKMDGFETTKQIRQGNGGGANKDIPIIAMCSTQREGLWIKCSSAGMNDYITMPIEPEVVDQKLTQWGTPPSLDSVVASPEHAVWDKDEVLTRMKGKQDRLFRIVEMFLKNLPSNMQALEASIEHKEMNTAKENAHVIKGVAANIGGTQLMMAMSKCEAACKEGNVELAREILPLCLKQSEQLSEELRRYVRQSKAGRSR